MFLVNSRLGLFTAARSLWLPFSLTYGVILPSSLTKVLPRVLGFSPLLPVSVYGTGDILLDSGFSWQCGVGSFSTYFRSTSHFILMESGFAYFPDFVLVRLTNWALRLSSCVPTYFLSLDIGTGISTCCPSTTPFGLALGPDLP